MTADAHIKADELKAKADQIRKDAQEFRNMINLAYMRSRSEEFGRSDFGKTLLAQVNEREGELLKDLRNQYKSL